MRRRASGALALLALVVLVVLWALDMQSRPPAPRAEAGAPTLGAAAPEFELPLLHDAAQRTSAAGMRGRVWLLNVWASWCAPCRQEHPLLLEIARDGRVPLLGLNYQDDARAAQEWLLQAGDPFVASGVDRDGSAAARWGVDSVPQTLVIDAAGVVRHRHVGALTREHWQRTIEPLLGTLQPVRHLDCRHGAARARCAAASMETPDGPQAGNDR
jgi:cytochrome c biogenesis protein CcmG/thiol:disulfide interchange protein DsbE